MKKAVSQKILKAIKNSNKILLHCHPYPDPDSVGSVLAMSLFLKSLKKDFETITGDFDYPQNLKKLPHAQIFQKKNFTQVDLSKFDLFLILDSSAPTQITQLKKVSFPKKLQTIVIDHHKTNEGFGDINLILPQASATSEIVFDLFQSWDVKITKDIALCLFIGIFGDTGGFKYANTSFKTLDIASKLARINPNFHELIFDLENSRNYKEVEYMALALNSLETFFDNKVAVSCVTYEQLKKQKIPAEYTQCGIPTLLASVIGWDLALSMVEVEPNKVVVGIRTRDAEKFDTTLIAKSIGEGGGHKAASGTTVKGNLQETKKQILKIIKKMYKWE